MTVLSHLEGLDFTDVEFEGRSVHPRIASSWRRAARNGVVPNTDLSNLCVQAVDLESRLALAASPVLDQVGRQLDGTTFSLVLADREGVVLDRRWGEARVASALDDVGIVEGRRFAEETSGPNGIGTVLELREGFTIVGEEHFVEALKRFACYGHPIVNPVTRTIEGVLDISCPAEHATPLLRPFVMSTAAMIEQGLAQRASMSDRIVVETYRTAVRRRRRAPVLVVHDGAVVANASAVELLEAADQAILRDLAETATVLAAQVQRVHLTSGIEVEVRFQSIEYARGAVLFEIDRVQPNGGTVAPRPRTSSDPTLPAELLDSRSSRAPALVAGEPGSGRTTIARAVAGESPIHVVESTSVDVMGAQTWLADVASCADGPTMALIENVHLLPDEVAHRLSALIEQRNLWVTLTSGPITSVSGEQAGLIARCVARTETVPLRRRSAEFAIVVRSMLARLDTDPTIRFTPETIEILAAHTWPGNLRELSEVLRQVLARRSKGDVLPADLPVAYRRGARSRQLNRVQQFEHDAIVAALRANDGNKVAAAEELGMSRSTLYRRIRTLRVPDDV